ncbi:MAG: class I SAM-dependent methyltransferase [Bacteroidetes bacterium]|jgi:SAM-dependent methyltransferase|nr:class I SAM-dependent methyltransferase [Bacteroidota bacterium]MBK9481180.1 class I SAM-dependent methyltransferase [Bacteroidota bacterium]
MDKSTNIVSPITNGEVNFLFDISKKIIVNSYLVESNIDVNYLFKNIDVISVYECIDTGYRFFYPFHIAGDGPFYEKLEQISWYYADWKWDYEIAKDFITPNSSVLDIGCGEGKFLNYLKENKSCECTGLELNEKAKQIAVAKGINVLNEFIQDHAISNSKKYDTVTFFQVLEHISDVNSFLKSTIDVVKSNGKVIIAVPNNEPFYLTFDKYHFLNLPPHHMGWWNQNSLSSLAKLYNLKLDIIIKQPLEHFSSYTNSYINEKLPRIGFLKPILYPMLKILFYLNRKKINGATILAVYTKL